MHIKQHEITVHPESNLSGNHKKNSRWYFKNIQLIKVNQLRQDIEQKDSFTRYFGRVGSQRHHEPSKHCHIYSWLVLRDWCYSTTTVNGTSRHSQAKTIRKKAHVRQTMTIMRLSTSTNTVSGHRVIILCFYTAMLSWFRRHGSKAPLVGGGGGSNNSWVTTDTVPWPQTGDRIPPTAVTSSHITSHNTALLFGFHGIPRIE